jgi:hypothetical protein
MALRLPLIVVILFGSFMLVQFFFQASYLDRAYQEVLDWVQIVYLFTLWVGVLNLIKLHVKKTQQSKSQAFYSLVTLSGIAVMLLFGLFGGKHPGSVFDWMFNQIQVPLQATMFSLLAFFVASAAYRGFRAHSREAFILLLVAALVMLGRVPIANLISASIPDMANWILNFPSMAARRGILIGIGLGTVATALRIIFGIERTYLGR